MREEDQQRREVAEAFYHRYVDLGIAAEPEEIIDAIAELIAYDGDLDQITQMMALSIDS